MDDEVEQDEGRRGGWKGKSGCSWGGALIHINKTRPVRRVLATAQAHSCFHFNSRCLSYPSVHRTHTTISVKVDLVNKRE
jgi:hypothetical protein